MGMVTYHLWINATYSLEFRAQRCGFVHGNFIKNWGVPPPPITNHSSRALQSRFYNKAGWLYRELVLLCTSWLGLSALILV
jgi:hypothetical protein